MERYQWRRYDYPEDRFNFDHWVNTFGPCKEKYWWYNIERDILVIDIVKGCNRMCYNVSIRELQSFTHGWRTLVALVVKQVRNALRNANKP